VLPKNVPSSFEGEYGNVRYYIRAFMDKTWRFDQETSAKFKVLNPVDLNKIPGLKVTKIAKSDKTNLLSHFFYRIQ